MAKNTFLSALKDTFGEQAKVGEDAAQASHAALWNPGCPNKPCALVACSTTADVQRTVQLATKHGVQLSVLGGGNHWAGFAVAPDGLVLDLRPMSKVHVDRSKRRVKFSGGSRINDVLLSLPDDMATVTGAVSSVGYPGIALGGGYGPLNSRFGLVCDTLRSAEVVLADGTVVIASEAENSDLLWALRGGGGNYGVVTSMEIELFPLDKVQFATVLVPQVHAKEAYLRLQEILHVVPEEMSVLSGLVTLHDGSKGVFMQPLLSAESEDGERLFEAVCSLEGARVIGRRWCAYKDIFDREAEKAWSSSRAYLVSARLCEVLTEEVVGILVGALEKAPTHGCNILLHDFHGKASRIPIESAAFPLRKVHYLVEVIAGWNTDAEISRAHEWFDSLLSDLSPHALPGGYPNVMGRQERQRVHEFYEPVRLKLEAVKSKFDPHNVFSSNVVQPQPSDHN